MFQKFSIAFFALFLCITAAQAKKEPRYVPPTPLSPEQAALVQRAIDREKITIRLIQKSTPLVQTYIQNLRPDSALYAVPVSDDYSLARVDFGKAFSANLYENIKTPSHAFFKGSFKFLGDLTKSFHISYSETGFMDMMFLDPSSFDMQHYDFSYVRRDFLGTVRTMVFDVCPKPTLKGAGRFFGRVWIEDRDGNVVRFNGTYTGNGGDGDSARYFHFDSWRTNVQPDVWLPTAIYVEETQRAAAPKAVGFRAQTYFWGYSLKLPQREAENESIQIANAEDQSDSSQDVSPLQAQRQWVSQAENNVLDRLTQAGLLAPPSDFDKVLETVTNNIIIGNKLALPDDIHCRVMLTTPLESLSVGNTIIISKGLIDVLPSEEDLAAVLSFQLAHIVLGHHIDTSYAFNDRLLFPDEAAFKRISMNHSDLDNYAAAKKATELFSNSVYEDKAGSVGLFYQQLEIRQKSLSFLLTPRIGDALLRTDGVPWLADLAKGGPKLDINDLEQNAALPLSSHLRIDPWNDQVVQLNVRPAPLINARDKMPFEVTPIYFRLQRFEQIATGPKAPNTPGLPSAPEIPLVPEPATPPPNSLHPLPPSSESSLEGAFPWPPPRWSYREVIDIRKVTHGRLPSIVGDVDDLLSNALTRCDYSDRSYFETPDHGFILVTRMEKIEPDGTPAKFRRWSFGPSAGPAIPLDHVVFTDYLKALFLADPGYYRVVVFVVSDMPFSANKTPTDEKGVTEWLTTGKNILPREVTTRPFTDKIICTALIYEFAKPIDSDDKYAHQTFDHLNSHGHLVQSGIWRALVGN